MSSKKKQISRRSFLKGAGGVAIALPVLEMMGSDVVLAQSSETYFLQIITPWGFDQPNFTPGPNMDLSGKIHQALDPHKNKLLFVTGLGSRTPGELNATHGHGECAARAFGGTPGISSDTTFACDHSSIDQVIADAIGGSTRFRSIELQSDQSRTDWIGEKYSWRIQKDAQGNVVSSNFLPREKFPRQAFDRIFQGVTSGPGQGPSASEIAEVDKGKSVLDLLKNELTTFLNQLSGNDKALMDQHLTSLRELERRVTSLPPSVAGCSVPTIGSMPGLELNEAQYRSKTQAMGQIAVNALACGLTKVASIQMVGRRHNLGWGEYHDVAHDPNNRANRLLYERWYADRVKEILDELDARGILDRTVVLVNSAESDGNHANPKGGFSDHFHRVLVAGNVNGYFNTGRHVNFGGQGDYINRFYLNLLEAFGVQASTFGDPNRCGGGKLSGLT